MVQGEPFVVATSSGSSILRAVSIHSEASPPVALAAPSFEVLSMFKMIENFTSCTKKTASAALCQAAAALCQASAPLSLGQPWLEVAPPASFAAAVSPLWHHSMNGQRQEPRPDTTENAVFISTERFGP